MVTEPWWTMAVPRDLLANTSLPSAARYLFMVLQGECEVGTASVRCSLPTVMRACGMWTEQRVRQHLKALVRFGWVHVERAPGPGSSVYALRLTGPAVPVPVALVTDVALAPAAKVLYAAAAAHYPDGSFAVRQDALAGVLGLGSHHTLNGLLTQLVTAGWMQVTRGPGARTYQYTLLDPHWSARDDLVRRVHARIERAGRADAGAAGEDGEGRAGSVGEAILKEMLNVLVTDPDYVDNDRPDWLINILTRERLELDRVYRRAKVAIEFQGAQHFQPTSFASAEDVRAQQMRDRVKEVQVKHHKHTLLKFLTTDLRWDRLIQMVSGVLPMRPLRRQDPVVRYLTRRAERYRRQAKVLGPDGDLS